MMMMMMHWTGQGLAEVPLQASHAARVGIETAPSPWREKGSWQVAQALLEGLRFYVNK
jgi:hypothetical protein